MPNMAWSEYHHRAAGREFLARSVSRAKSARFAAEHARRSASLCYSRPMAKPKDLHASGPRTLWVIGGFKLAKGPMLVAVGVGALHMLHQDVADLVAGGFEHVHADPDHRKAYRVVAWLLFGS